MSNIQLVEPHRAGTEKITQLYEYLELYSYGKPTAHALFVLSRKPLHQIENVAQLDALNGATDQLLIVDPPPDLQARFKLEGDVAVLFSESGVQSEADHKGANEVESPYDPGLPHVQTMAGGVAHLRIGDHFLDIYSQGTVNILHFPAVGIVCGASFGSDTTLPRIARGSDGEGELDTLRLLARLVKESRLQLYIPRIGSLVNDPIEVLKRLAADVAYLHGLRRVLPTMAVSGASDDNLLDVVETLLPKERCSEPCREIHIHNALAIYEASL